MKEDYLKLLSVVLTLLFCTGLPAHASVEDLREAYSAYQEAAAQDDLHAALPHARAAYGLAMELHGPTDATTGSAALDYARVLARVIRWEQSIEVLSATMPIFRAEEDTNPSRLFEALYLLGRAQRHIPGLEDDFDFGDHALEEALVLGRQLYGEISEEVGLVFLEMGRPDLRRAAPWVSNLNGGYIHGDLLPEASFPDALVQSQEIFERYPNRELELAQIRVMQGLSLLIENDEDGASELIGPAIDRLADAEFVDDTMVSAYLTLVQYRSAGLSRRQRRQDMGFLVDYAAMRQYGRLHRIAISAPRYPPHLMRQNVQGHLEATYDVGADGEPQNIVITISPARGRFDSVSRRALSDSRFLPRMENGVAIETEGLHFGFDFEIGTPR